MRLILLAAVLALAAAPAALAAAMDDNRETLAGATGQSMAEELIAGGDAWRLDQLGPGLPASWSSTATTACAPTPTA